MVMRFDRVGEILSKEALWIAEMFQKQQFCRWALGSNFPNAETALVYAEIVR